MEHWKAWLLIMSAVVSVLFLAITIGQTLVEERRERRAEQKK